MSNDVRTCGRRIARNVAWSLPLFTAVIGGHAAFGAPVRQPKTAASPDVLQEVIVTAEKRISTVQKTPISITAITGAELQAQGITRLEDAQVPGLSMHTSGPGQTEYEIRGISNSNSDTESGAQATTGFYLDEVPIEAATFATAGFTTIDPDLFDVARVEVLRGPQGTLYGAGSEGGTIKVVTNKPDLKEFSGAAEGTASGTQHGGFNGSANIMLNMPIIDDKIAVRIVGTDKHDSGWIDRVVVPNFPLETVPSASFYGTVRGDLSNPVGAQVHHGVNDTDLRSVRASVLFKPIEQLTIEPAFYYQRVTQGGFSAYDSSPGGLAHYQPFDVAEPYVDEFRIYSLDVNYDFPGFSVTSVSAYQVRSSTVTEDSSEQIQDALFLPSFNIAGGGAGAQSTPEANSEKRVSQELRLTSTADGPFQWLMGGFYSVERGHFADSAVSPAFEPILLAYTGTASDNVFMFFLRDRKVETSAFGNGSYAVTHKLKATVGLRYSYIKDTTGVSESGFASQTGNDSVFDIDEVHKSYVLNPMFNISYSPMDDLMLYTTAARGFRSGAGVIPAPVGGTYGTRCLTDVEALGFSQVPTSVRSEHVWSYEAGEKGRFFDQAVTLNADAFYEKLSDVQVGLGLSCGFATVVNAPSARSVGTEIELNGRLGSHVELSQGVSYTNAEATANAPGIQNGQPLPNVPKWNLSTSIQYKTPVSDTMQFVARLRNSYTSSHVNGTPYQNFMPGYDIVAARIGVVRDAWSGFLFVDNLTNKLAQVSRRPDLTIALPTFDRIITNQPRTIGIDLAYSF